MFNRIQDLVRGMLPSSGGSKNRQSGNDPDDDDDDDDKKDEGEKPTTDPKTKHPALRHWDSHAKQNRILIACLGLVVVISVVSHVRMVEVVRAANRVVILDSTDTFYVSTLEAADLESPVFARTAVIATEVILNRTPAGLKMKELTGILTEGAYDRLQDEVQEQSREFKDKNMIWEPQVTEVQAEREQRGLRIYSVSGELVQIGAVDGQAFIDPVEFKLLLGMEANPNLGQRRQFPFKVASFNLRLGEQ